VECERSESIPSGACPVTKCIGVESFCYSTGGYEVHGIIRRSSSFNTGRIDLNNPDIHGKTLFLHYGDLTDSSNLNRLLEKTEPDEIYPVS